MRSSFNRHFCRKKNKGVTLAELCIVMALLSIITVMVTSFCLITRSYTIKVSADTDIKLSISNLETGLRIWLSSVDSVNYTLSVSEDGSALIATGSGAEDTWRLELKDNHLYGLMPSGARINFEMPRVVSLYFGIFNESGVDKPCFVYCDMNYEKINNSSNTQNGSVTIRRATRVLKKATGGG